MRRRTILGCVVERDDRAARDGDTRAGRRRFLKTAGLASAGAILFGGARQAGGEGGMAQEVPRRQFGRTGVQVSALGLGGYDIGKYGIEREAIRVVQEAVDAGVTFLDNAWEYNEGKSEEWMGKALVGRRDKVFLMTKLCSHGRDKQFSLRMLDESLRRLKTDHLDLWQIHEVVYEDEPDRHFAKGGAVEALAEAKQQGKVRFVGFTGHKDPAIHLKMLAHDFPFDACQLPLNAFDAGFRSFERQVLPELNRRGIAAIGMKSMGGGGEPLKGGAVTPAEALRYAMSLPVATTVSGMPSLTVLQQNLEVARGFTAMSAAEMEALRGRVAAVAADGRFELYKTSMKYDGDEGRKQHGFPPSGELGG
jgi:predicted aldo/keto reductase-like oxidoreductase